MLDGDDSLSQAGRRGCRPSSAGREHRSVPLNEIWDQVPFVRFLSRRSRTVFFAAFAFLCELCVEYCDPLAGPGIRDEGQTATPAFTGLGGVFASSASVGTLGTDLIGLDCG